MNIEKELEQEMLSMYKRAGEETGYWGNYFLRAVRNNGGLVTAKKMLTEQSKTTPAKGLQALTNAKRLDLSLEALVLQPKFQSLFNKTELDEARRRLSPFSDSYFPNGKNINISLSTWILQGNPKRFNIDDYLSRYSYIYWSAPKYQKDFNIGDSIYIWRAGEEAGVIAYGVLEELPTPLSQVRFPNALGDDLWRNKDDSPTEIKIGVHLEQIRLNRGEGMLERELVKRNPILGKNRIITQPNDTVFKFDETQSHELARLWNNDGEKYNQPFIDTFSVSEGSIELRYHYQRERSTILIKRKKEEFKKVHEKLECEICRFSFEENYPTKLGKDFIEAHHKIPLSKINATIKTTLEDLILVCSNCHRMIHRTKECENNLQELMQYFKEREIA
jgi:hypothetical protein